MNKNTNLLAWWLLLILALIWGSSFILIKRGLDVFSAGEVGALRIISASVFLLPFALNSLKHVRKRHWLFLFSVGMFGSFLPAFLFAKAQTNLPSSVAGILNALTPLFTMILGAIFFTQRFSARTIIGLLVGFLGTLALILAGSGGEVAEFNFYALYVILATIFYGTNLNLIKFKIPDLNARTITSISLLIVGPLAVVYLVLFTDFIHKVQHAEGAILSLTAVVTLGVLGTAIALILFNQLVKITSPVFTSSVTYLIPIIAVLWGILDGENLYPGHYTGLVLIILGVYLSNRTRKPRINP
ncbi:Permease of the drug/metabolite transporter (DMT) superfamily [Fulvivirga imtechensis AK7]|uniref:Permease of the drug/metabolite transporter (DMT) superfamily n=1 Tax=Fulvivirga imtechensis AK7 TaxID=1237149 RepID=L8JR33_9BACT|nr:DMT family transporter [Fulvivirga imtechensis]ELR71436.1 Permease of the drug/metabolite transporter (DMT) superfamily [Fulvivirga imtechensis AK7]